MIESSSFGNTVRIEDPEWTTHTKIPHDPSQAKRLTEEYIKYWFGPRCPEYAAGCHACNAWSSFDVIFGDVE